MSADDERWQPSDYYGGFPRRRKRKTDGPQRAKRVVQEPSSKPHGFFGPPSRAAAKVRRIKSKERVERVRPLKADAAPRVRPLKG